MNFTRLEPIDIEAIELRRIALPLVSPFRTSFGTETARPSGSIHSAGAPVFTRRTCACFITIMRGMVSPKSDIM